MQSSFVVRKPASESWLWSPLAAQSWETWVTLSGPLHLHRQMGRVQMDRQNAHDTSIDISVINPDYQPVMCQINVIYSYIHLLSKKICFLCGLWITEPCHDGLLVTVYEIRTGRNWLTWVLSLIAPLMSTSEECLAHWAGRFPEKLLPRVNGLTHLPCLH